MPKLFRHFAAALIVAVVLWILPLGALLRMDGLTHEPAPWVIVAAIASLFLLPGLTLGLWAHSSPTLPAWPRARILLAWCVWLVPVALTLIAVHRVDAVAVAFLATITLPLIVLTGLWLERRHRGAARPPPGAVA